MAMRDDIKVAILAGGATRESLLALTGTTEKGLASQFTYMRMMGNCPRKKDDGTFEIITTEEWEAHKAASGSASTKSLTPGQRVDRAEKRSKRAASAYDSAKTRLEADPDDKLKELKFIKAEAELEIAEIELGNAERVYMESDTPESHEPVNTPDEDDEYGDTYDDGEDDEELE